MKQIALLAALALAACSTVESRHEKAPVAEFTTAQSLEAFQGCFAGKTEAQQVQYLPRSGGGSFSSGEGPQRFVYWIVDVDDLGASRLIKVYAVSTGMARQRAIPAVQACI